MPRGRKKEKKKEFTMCSGAPAAGVREFLMCSGAPASGFREFTMCSGTLAAGVNGIYNVLRCSGACNFPSPPNFKRLRTCG